MGLTILFLVTAFFYASVGFGGGSTYNALLVLSGVDYRILPVIALLCNIIVVTGGVWHFARAGHIQIRQTLPWIIFSVPASFIGGMIPIHETLFIGLLGTALLLSGIRMLWPEKDVSLLTPPPILVNNRPVQSFIATALGFLAGITGIGGGIFLAPVLHLLKSHHAKTIAAICALFILVNSLAGLAGQILKLEPEHLLPRLLEYGALFPAVLVGGQLGAWLGATRMNIHIIKKGTAILILIVSVRLLAHFVGTVV